MKTALQLFSSIVLMLSMASCEDVIQVKLDKGNPILTIDAFVNDMRTPQKVRLTYTDNYFSQKTNEPVTGATVMIKDIHSGKVFNFVDHNNGDYLFTLPTADTFKVGHRYQLTVTHQGTNYTATSLLNRTTIVDSIDAKYEKAGAFGGQEGYKCAFLGLDSTGPVSDYYWIKSYRNGVFFNRGGDINIAWNGASGEESDGLFFIPPIAFGITPNDEVFKKWDVCRVEIHSINEETYNFLTQVLTQTTNFGLFATTPENVKSNITSSNDKTRVVGWFCMSSVSFKEKTVQ